MHKDFIGTLLNEFKHSKLRDDSTFNLYLCFLIISYDVT